MSCHHVWLLNQVSNTRAGLQAILLSTFDVTIEFMIKSLTPGNQFLSRQQGLLGMHGHANLVKRTETLRKMLVRRPSFVSVWYKWTACMVSGALQTCNSQTMLLLRVAWQRSV